MKRERGFGLIEVLIALALLIVITAMIGVNLQQVIQANNEKNAQSGVLAIMTAEAGYQSSYSAYATGANLHYLSDCPAPVTQNGKTTVTPTATAACLNISRTYTNNQTAYQFNFAVEPTAGPDGVLGTSDDGYLVTATPVNSASGRQTYCANNQDGLLRGNVNTKTITTPTTSATCDEYNVIAAGATSTPAPPAPSAQTLQFTAPATHIGTAMAPQTITLPSGLWHVTAALNFEPNSSTYTLPNMGCELYSGSTILDIGYSATQSGSGNPPPGLMVTGLTPSSTTSVTFQCWQANQNGIISTTTVNTYPAYNLVITAVPVSGVGTPQS